jgi:hypothetical protein|tara:strand:- start:514 stop:753 length:240 start_codon:yes stop_codon:yes gene_type:complete
MVHSGSASPSSRKKSTVLLAVPTARIESVLHQLKQVGFARPPVGNEKKSAHCIIYLYIIFLNFKKEKGKTKKEKKKIRK